MSKPFFVKSSCEKTSYRGHKVENNPINLSLVTSIVKTRENWYPDNKGTPSIKFQGIDITWIYGIHQTEQRDLDYENLITNKIK